MQQIEIKIADSAALQLLIKDQVTVHRSAHCPCRQYAAASQKPVTDNLSDRIVQYMSEHSDRVTLKDIAAQFSYHPNYISTLLRREVGKSFSEILLSQRMERAVILLRGTDLTISEIALMLGYSNSSNFYKTFREYYGVSPREYAS